MHRGRTSVGKIRWHPSKWATAYVLWCWGVLVSTVVLARLVPKFGDQINLAGSILLIVLLSLSWRLARASKERSDILWTVGVAAILGTCALVSLLRR